MRRLGFSICSWKCNLGVVDNHVVPILGKPQALEILNLHINAWGLIVNFNMLYSDETQAPTSSLANSSGSFAISRNHVPVTNMDQLYMQVHAAHYTISAVCLIWVQWEGTFVQVITARRVQHIVTEY
jgi:hypothetical protein